jgi:hypothetical protein
LLHSRAGSKAAGLDYRINRNPQFAELWIGGAEDSAISNKLGIAAILQ